ncbi:MAG: glycerate kinase [Candidatus Coatesbacteria bacterium]|nr:MAG: glycerate kinase [Candidatus Coatesbacteria bacterium]
MGTVRKLRADALRIFEAGLAAVDGAESVRRAVLRKGDDVLISAFDAELRVNLSEHDRLFLVGGGKAGAVMAEALVESLGEDAISAGAITVPLGSERPDIPECIEVFGATHPLPSDSAVEGVRRMLELAEGASERDLVFFLLSGGASSMLPLPADGITLADKVETTKQLLASGATIDEINAIRKHISAIKGGQFLLAARPARVISLIISDVIGDRLESVGSGPTVRDTTTFADCLEIVRRYRLSRRLPASVMKRLRDGARGKFSGPEDMPDKVFERCDNVIVSNNDVALVACQEAAESLGYATANLGSRVFGEAREVAKVMVGIAQSCQARGYPARPPCCIISGGELTVTITGDGVGGRNQEFALAAALHLSGTDGIVVLSAGTDGIDGSSDAAGAIVDGGTAARGAYEGMEITDYLARNDSFSYLDAIGDTIVTGRTGTNVMDIRLVMVDV